MNLSPLEARILGSLIEKEQTTPAVYPLTLNALVTACNQTSSRDPLMSVSEHEVTAALESLQSRKLLWQVLGGRAVRWQHNLERAWNLDSESRALAGLLLLRGAQTAGELKTRSERLHAFSSVEAVESTLRRMVSSEPVLAQELARESGRRETRWTAAMHPVQPPVADRAGGAEPATRGMKDLESRVAALEAATDSLEAALNELATKLGA